MGMNNNNEMRMRGKNHSNRYEYPYGPQMRDSVKNDPNNNGPEMEQKQDLEELLSADIKTCHQIIINKGLPTDGTMTDYELYLWFLDCSGFIGIRWGKEEREKSVKYKNFAFADFVTKEDANNAILRKNELSIGGQQLSLRIVNKELTITPEMRQIYYSVIIQYKKKRNKLNKNNRRNHKKRPRPNDKEKNNTNSKRMKIKIENENEYNIRKRRDKIHNKLDQISRDLEKYEKKMNEKYNEMFLNDPNLSKLCKNGMEGFIEGYKNAIKQTKKH